MQLPDYRLTFDGAEFDGLEVVMGRLTISELFDLNDVLALPSASPQEAREYWDSLASFVGKHMVSWNLTDRDDAPVPVGQVDDWNVLTAIRDGWLEGLNGGRSPLPPSPAIEAELPVDPLPAPSGNDSEPAS